MLGNSLAGYIQAKSGRQLTFMIPGANLPISSIAKFKQILPTTKPAWWPPSSKPSDATLRQSTQCLSATHLGTTMLSPNSAFS